MTGDTERAERSLPPMSEDQNVNNPRQPETTALSIIEPIDKLVEDMNKFEQLKQDFLIDDDWQIISEKRHIKRSGFRKIALAFGLSDEIIEQVRIDKADGSFVWRFRVRVWAKNGRSSEGVGACDSKERNFAHTEHDVYAIAHTRAKSRAISDLVAGGAVSAEEVEAEVQAEEKIEGPTPRRWKSSQEEAATVQNKAAQVEKEEKPLGQVRPAPVEAQGPKQEVASPKPGKPFAASLQEMFPRDLWDLLIFEEGTDVIIVKPRHYLPQDYFQKVMAEVKKYGGGYISDGEHSRFQIPKP